MEYTLTISGNVLAILPIDTLITNRQYTVTVLAGLSGVNNAVTHVLQNDYVFYFTSTYCPIFSTPTKIKLEVGPSAENLLDDTIYRMIHKNSLDAVDIYNVSHGTAIPYDYWGCTWHDVPIQLRRYVECKTAYDILALLKQIGGGSSPNGDQLKTLGDMTIKYGGSSGGSSGNAADPSKMKSLFDCWNESLRGIQSIRIAVKGYYDVSKGYAHPVREPYHNRVIRPVVRNVRNTPDGPWKDGYYWQRFDV